MGRKVKMIILKPEYLPVLLARNSTRDREVKAKCSCLYMNPKLLLSS
ncbi:protein of unknown function [Acetoanaerobium sticklandii]|uniref:Uncharacterized protein n=1 Tax=Acetoanaerobium sticklandii (strain ATCC 12662 / DSM 519 / JCM 1433 / CCUG 9281 / NCIMB 10654 / HF) TaxID=499177 RepID=E3PTI0_ACESD|nr:protein of unknown function [Acetoanaerobium sticklandii]